jgi:hypothetical protein
LAPYGDWSEDQRARLGQQMVYPQWLGPVSIDADDLMADKRPAENRKDVDQAVEWLEGFLKERPQESLRCVDMGDEQLGVKKPLKWWRDSVLKDKLRGKPRKTGFGEEQRWWFTLPHHPWPFPGLEESEESQEGEESFSSSTFNNRILSTKQPEKPIWEREGLSASSDSSDSSQAAV